MKDAIHASVGVYGLTCHCIGAADLPCLKATSNAGRRSCDSLRLWMELVTWRRVIWATFTVLSANLRFSFEKETSFPPNPKEAPTGRFSQAGTLPKGTAAHDW